MNPILILLRILLPLLLIPRWPLLGGIVALILDNLDWGTKHLFGIDPILEYQAIDKTLDTFYLALLAYTSLYWKDKLARNVSVFLFLYRLLGVILFEFTHMRWLLFVFPNIFENFFFSYLLINFFSKNRLRLTKGFLPIMLIVVGLPKMVQEYLIHILQGNIPFTVFGVQLEFKAIWSQVAYILIFCAITAYYVKKRSESANVTSKS